MLSKYIRYIYLAVVLVVLFLLVGPASGATYYVETSDTTVDGDTFCGGTCDATDTIIIRAGARGGLLFQDFDGAGSYITIMNEDNVSNEVVEIDGMAGQGCLSITNCKYIDLRGNNEPAQEYGIKVINDMTSQTPGTIWVYGESDHINLSYLEATCEGSTVVAGNGIFVNDANLNAAWIFDTFDIHHNYIHDTRYAGMYLGHNDPTGNNKPYIARFTVHDNILNDLGTYGMVQKGAGGGPNYFYNNTVNTTGLVSRPELSDDWRAGIRVRTFTSSYSVDVYNNSVYNTMGAGIEAGKGLHNIYNNFIYNCGTNGTDAWGHGLKLYIGASGSHVYNNVIVESGVDGIRVGSTASGNVSYNTIINSTDDGIEYSSPASGTIQDNLVVGSGGTAITAPSGTLIGNVIDVSFADCAFEDSANYNYDFTSSTHATIIDEGDAPYPAIDFEGRTRPYGSFPDIGAYEYPGSIYYVETSDTTVDGDTFCDGVCDATDTIIIRAGARGSIWFKDFDGAGSYITIKNEDNVSNEQVVITASTQSAFLIEDCKYLDFQGNNDADTEYGIKVINDGYPVTANTVKVLGQSEHINISYFEIAFDGNTGLSGIGISVNDGTESPSWIYDGIHIHHNYIHGARYASMYLGPNNPGVDGPWMANVLVHDNIMEDNGAYGMTLKGVHTSSGVCSVYNNTIRPSNPSSGNSTALVYDDDEKNTGISIHTFDGAAYANIYNNRVEKTVGAGIRVGAAKHQIYDNEVLGCGVGNNVSWGHGIVSYYQADDVNVYDNIIIQPTRYGVYAMAGADAGGTTLSRNLIGDAGIGEWGEAIGGQIIESGGDDANTYYADVATFGFDVWSDDGNYSNDQFTFGESGDAPNITSWENNDTNDNTLDITIDVNQNVIFNVTANQTITTWTWKKDTVDQSHNYDNITLSWTSTGVKTVTVTATNANGTSDPVQWNVTVNCITPSWYDSDYAKRLNLTIDHTYVNGNQTDHPVYINETISDLIGNVQDNGDDIIFVDYCSQTKLSDMKERAYNPTTGHIEAWFKVPHVYGDTNTTVQMYYGNATASNTEDADSTWNSGFAAVYLFAEDAGSYTNDSSGNNNNGTGTNLAWGRLGLDLPGSNEHVSITNFIEQDDDWTIITRFIQDTRNPYSQTSPSTLVSMNTIAAGTGRAILFIKDTPTATYLPATYISGTLDSADTAIATETTYNFAMSQEGTSFKYYLNGSTDGTATLTADPANGNIILFDQKAATGDGCFDGTLDYLLWYTGAMNQGTIETIHNNTNSPDTFITVGSESQLGSAPNITSWQNNKTSDSSFDIALNVSEVINFNVTANQSIDSWNWYDGGIDQSNNYDNWTQSWTGTGLKTVIVNATNANGTTSSKQWNITVSNPNWYDPLWIQMKTLTINQTMVNQTIGDVHYILLVDMVDGDLTKAQADGDDIIFTDSTNTTQLPHQLSSFNSTTGAIVAYVGLTDLSNVSSVNMYYNNSVATNSEDKAGTWGVNASGVWLMDEGTGAYVNDSSGNNNNGTIHGADWVDDGLSFVTANEDYVDYGNDSSVHIAGDITIAVDINATSWVSEANIMSYSNGGETSDVNSFYGFVVVNDPCDILLGHEYNEGVNQYEVFNTNLAVDTDYRLYAVRDSTAKTWTLYIDGEQFGTAYTYTNNPTGGENNLLLMGKTPYTVDPVFHDGIVTNARVFDIVRSASYISTTDNNTEYPTLFLSLGPELPGGDSTPPTYSNVGHSTVEAGDSCIFSIQYNDDTALESTGEYIFSTNNTGSWVNESSVSWTVTPQWANVTKILNTVHDFIVGYMWYAEDDAGNVNNTAIYTLTVQDTTPPASITSLTSSTGNFWHNWTWTDPTDADFNYTTVYINNSWVVNTTNEYYNLSAAEHNTSIISTKTVDTTGNVNPTWTNHTSNIPNNLVTITNTSDWSDNEGQNVYVDYDSTDDDSDTPTFSCNRTDLFTDFSTSTGIGNWTTNYTVAGNYTIDFGVDDGYGSSDNYTMNVTVTDYGTPGIPTGLSSTADYLWVNNTWTAGNNTDTFNVSHNSTWTNGSALLYFNTTLSAHGWSNITVHGYNSTSGQTSNGVSLNTQALNRYNFTFTNAAATPTIILQGATSAVSIDISDQDGTINSAIVKIRDVNYTMTQGSGDTWSYTYIATAWVGKHYITDFYAQDNDSAWNSTTSSLYINVLESSGGGGGAPGASIPTATPTATPTVTPSEELKDENITIPNVFKIITGEGFSMFKINFGVNNPVYSKTIKYGDIESCAVLDSDFVACDASNEKVRVIVKPQLEGVYNYDISYVQLIDNNETIHDIPVEIIVLDTMGWVNIPNMQVSGLPDILFEKEPITNDVIGMRLWWVFGLMGIGLYRMNKK